MRHPTDPSATQDVLWTVTRVSETVDADGTTTEWSDPHPADWPWAPGKRDAEPGGWNCSTCRHHRPYLDTLVVCVRDWPLAGPYSSHADSTCDRLEMLELA